MINLDYLCRKFLPSTTVLSYNSLFILFGRILDFAVNIFFKEFKQLPPNHLRVRVGVGNRIYFNQVLHMEMGNSYWLTNFATNSLNLNSNILEIGCGCGRMIRHLKSVGFAGQYTGIDIDDEMLAYCRKFFSHPNYTFIKSIHKSKTYSSGDKFVDLKENEFYSIPIESDSQDFVYSTSLFTHLLERDLINYLSESFRVLKKDGMMQMSFFCIESMGENLNGRWSFKHKLGEAYIESLKYPEAAVAYSKDLIKSECYKLGFTEVILDLTSLQSTLKCRK